MTISLKKLRPTFLLIATVISGCHQNVDNVNKFSSSSDTLIIQTHKIKGRGLFSASAAPLEFDDSIRISQELKFPHNLTDIKIQHIPTDFSPENQNYIEIITGMIGNERVFIVDENNNKNLSDDSVRLLKKLNWDSTDGIFKCKYLKLNGEKSLEDSSWFQIREDQDIIWFGRKEHRIAELSIDNKNYKIGTTDLFSGFFSYSMHSWIALLSEGKIIKDSLQDKDILSIGEYLALGPSYYRFEKISANGEYVTLIKEKDFASKIGTQIGMLAPDFRCVTVSGDTINSSCLHDRILVIANSCGCGGDKESEVAYYDMKSTYFDSIYILRLDSKMDENLDGFQVDVQERFNKDIYFKYRKEYCSRMCYVIDKNNRIIDKFSVFEWKSNLPNHFKLQK